MNVLRILTRVTVSALAVIVSMTALTVLTFQQLAGTPTAAAHTVGAFIDDPASAEALGAALVDSISKDNADFAMLTASKSDLASAAARGLQSSRDQITAGVETGYQAALDGAAATVDLSGVVGNILAEMHAIDRKIPAILPTKQDGSTFGVIAIPADPHRTIAKINNALGMWWIGLLATSVLLGIVGALSRHGGTRRWRLSGGLLAGTSLMWVLAGRTGPSTALQKASMGDIQRHVMDGVLRIAEAKFLAVGIVGLVIGAVLVGVSFTRGDSAEPIPSAPAVEPAESSAHVQDPIDDRRPGDQSEVLGGDSAAEED